MTSGTRLNPMPEFLCWTEAACYQNKCRCRTNFSLALQHLLMIFQYHIARITPSAAVYGHAGCITFHYLQFWHVLGFPFTTNSNSFFKCRNVGLSASSKSDTEMTNIPMPKPVQYQNKGTQSCTGMLRYWTELRGAGMPMPSYGKNSESALESLLCFKRLQKTIYN